MNNGIFLLLGSNLGDRAQNLETSRNLIQQTAGRIVKASSIYQTAAWGKSDQPDFYNQVIEIETLLDPDTLLQTTLQIEEHMGRTRTEVWGSRIIDIDILLYGDVIVEHERLKIPHPQMTNRRFTLVPLSEIASEVIHPITRKEIRELLLICEDQLAVVKV
ncbi:2-amino-4-hydroxy-6-hydroxymethyldihydropteridine diphosphokinase [Ohtaekwangia koreensis]|uniref:2-amino-4-hydroxy-6-hydroxymethyldihydropteridine pyrophosphokinase n=1 Tax=Ohtaekwangia koreensis TaxID=688867 RepID=A0A1T5JZ58_9BACT|nr:2-amino-4-hydroxy-6-hydroxymethyldihydropteridine diphosphokinase [Ohtaekwangia koreensis]SKC56691.1 2-amino-4-hydroxy-6-hydroxymethyldihydropteridinediphosphokinase [Ohtaekwangia koreensis]